MTSIRWAFTSLPSRSKVWSFKANTIHSILHKGSTSQRTSTFARSSMRLMSRLGKLSRRRREITKELRFFADSSRRQRTPSLTLTSSSSRVRRKLQRCKPRFRGSLHRPLPSTLSFRASSVRKSLHLIMRICRSSKLLKHQISSEISHLSKILSFLKISLRNLISWPVRCHQIIRR